MSNISHIDFNLLFEQFFDRYCDDVIAGGSILCELIGVPHHINDEAGIAEAGENYCLYLKRGNITYVFGNTASMFPNCRIDGATFSVASIQSDASWELIDEAEPQFIDKHPMTTVEDVISWLRSTIT